MPHNPFSGATGGIWRVGATGANAVLKICTPGRPDAPAHFQASGEPGHWNTGGASRRRTAAGWPTPRSPTPG
ncbi:hypothetical protein GCM10020358_19950 [Amorphoplanes nipponensis]|uniref:hypothetical protein n=1 Tax=Actinoplanes nipponensis TaxID=135950 RepID=UPI0031F0413D